MFGRFTLPLWLCALALVGAAPAAQPQDDPPSVSLIARNSLAGWDHAGPPVGWSVEHGRLHAPRDAGGLLSGFTFGDVELRFRWTAASGSRLTILLPRCDDAAAIRIDAAGDDQPHETVIVRRGARLEWSTDASAPAHVELPHAARIGLALALRGGPVRIDAIHALEPPGSPIFNGRDLAGWWTPGNLASWIVQDGGLVCINTGGNYLRTEKEYANFTLSLEYKISRGGNSGIGIRTARTGWPSGDGTELQIMDEPPGKPVTRHSTMAIYGNLEPIDVAHRSEQFNRAVIKADGYMVSAWINGQLVQQVNTAHLPELKHRHLKGWIGFQDHAARVEFRNVRVLEAPDGLGLPAWYAPQNEAPSQTIVDRLMNPVRLAGADGIVSATTACRVSGSARQVLAHLEGPGAVVQVTRTAAAGTLEFYLDGQPQARIACPAAELHKHVPPLSENTHPVLTYIPFQKSLQIVLRDGKPGQYLIDYVKFPAGVSVEPYRDAETTTVRGLLPAQSYRFQQLGWSKFRDNDPAPRAHGQARTLDPGSSLPLVALDGAGYVQWLRLEGSNRLLAGDDLWIEVSVDGQQSPALAAPARYWFPGQSHGRWRNYVLWAGASAYATLLPMPFGDGLRITLTNRGDQPIHDAGVTLSYYPADRLPPGLSPPSWRLRGTFVTEKSAPDSPLIDLAGRGRLVGIVCQAGDDALPHLRSLIVDGQSRTDQQAVGLATLLGVAPQAVGDPAAQRLALCGRAGGLAWRYLWLAPLDFEQSLLLETDRRVGDRLVLYYAP